eukprot:Gb_12116 [translate_table: standard]
MFACLLDEMSDTERTAEQDPCPQGSDRRSMVTDLKLLLKPNIAQLVEEDNADGLEEALLAERTSELTPSSKKGKKKNRRNGSKEEDEFSVLSRRVLHYACALDSVKCCGILLASERLICVRVDVVDEEDQRSGLHIASFHHSHECVDFLLKQGANASLLNKHSMLPLEEALLSSSLRVDWDFSTSAAEIVKMIGEKDLKTLKILGAKSNCKDQLASLAFKLCKGLKLVPLVALLIVRRSIVNISTKRSESDEEPGGTIIDYLLGKVLASSPSNSLDKVPEKLAKCKKVKSGESGDSEVRNLNVCAWDYAVPEIKHRKDISEWEQINSKYRTSLNEAEADGKIGCLAKLPDKVSNNGMEDKFLAINDDLEINQKLARKILECALHFVQSWNVHSQNSSMPPLLRAVQANDAALVNALLEAGAPVNDIDHDGNTALHWALRLATPVNGRSVNCILVERLLDAGANVTAGNNLGATPIHTAAGHGHFEALYLIIKKHGGSINILAGTRETPLHYAVKNDHLACAALLLRHGANRDVISLRNQKPFQLASSSQMRNLLSLDEKALYGESSENLFTFCVSQPLSLPSALQSPSKSSFPAQGSSVLEHLSSSLGTSHTQSAPSAKHPSSFCPSNDLAVSFPQNVALAMPLSFSQALAMAPEHCSIQPSSHIHPLPASSPWELNQASNSSSWQTVHKNFRKHTHVSGSHSSDSDVLSVKTVVSLPPYKTVYCRFFGTSSKCAWGSKCHFAHSEEELQKGQQLQTLLGHRLEPIQGSSAVTDTADQGLKNYKTKLCIHYEKNGICPHKSKCIFAHGEGELRTTSVASSFGSGARLGPRPSTASSFGSGCSEEVEDTNSRKIFVGGLPPYVDARELREFIEGEFGKVVNATVICGNDADGIIRSRGFGFVLLEQQKDADKAVRRQFLPFQGKKVEIKKAMGRTDAASGDEGEKLTSSFSTISSPAFAAASSGVVFFNDGLHLPSSTSAGYHQGWSLPSLTAELPSSLPKNNLEVLWPLATKHELQTSVQKYGGHVSECTTSIQKSEEMEDFRQSEYLLPYVCATQCLSENSACSGRSGLYPFSQNSDQLFKSDNPMSSSPFHSYNLCSPQPLSSLPPPSMSNVSASSLTNGNKSIDLSSCNAFTYYGNNTSHSYFSTMPDSLPEVDAPDKTDDDDDDNEEFSRLLALLEVGSSSEPLHNKSCKHKTLTPNHGINHSILPASIQNGWSVDSFSTCQNMDSEFVYRDSLYSSAPQNRDFESTLLHSLQYPSPTERQIEVSQTLSNFQYDGLLPERFEYGGPYQLSVGSQEPSRVVSAKENDLSFQRFAASDLTNNILKASNRHVQDFRNLFVADEYDMGQYSRFGTST